MGSEMCIRDSCGAFAMAPDKKTRRIGSGGYDFGQNGSAGSRRGDCGSRHSKIDRSQPNDLVPRIQLSPAALNRCLCVNAFVKGSQLGAARMPQLGSLSASKSCTTGVEATKTRHPTAGVDHPNEMASRYDRAARYSPAIVRPRLRSDADGTSGAFCDDPPRSRRAPSETKFTKFKPSDGASRAAVRLSWRGLGSLASGAAMTIMGRTRGRLITKFSERSEGAGFQHFAGSKPRPG